MGKAVFRGICYIWLIDWLIDIVRAYRGGTSFSWVGTPKRVAEDIRQGTLFSALHLQSRFLAVRGAEEMAAKEESRGERGKYLVDKICE